MFKNYFLESIENKDKAMVRNDFKLWIYTYYLLPSNGLLLTIHVFTVFTSNF